MVSAWSVLSFVNLPGMPTGDVPFPSATVAASSAYVTVPIGILVVAVSRVFWQGRYLGLVRGYDKDSVEDPAALGRFMGGLLAGLGVYMIAFPLTVRWLGALSLIVFVGVIVGVAIALLVGSAWYERG
ncbi:MAG: hypothetical protein GF405_02200 [Candidatus Eisenbacteria bacterium]|nr:hypothetical protein [Candidatus Eisenbacteria bacterium]